MSEPDDLSRQDGIIRPLPKDFQGGHCDARYPSPCQYTNYDSRGECHSHTVFLYSGNSVLAKWLTSFDCHRLSLVLEYIPSHNHRFVAEILRFRNYDEEYVTTPAIDSPELIHAATLEFDEQLRRTSYYDGEHLTENQYDGDCGVAAVIEDGFTLVTREYDLNCRLLHFSSVDPVGTSGRDCSYTWDGDFLQESWCTAKWGNSPGETAFSSYFEHDAAGHYTHVSEFWETEDGPSLAVMYDWEYGLCGLSKSIVQTFAPAFSDGYLEWITEYDDCCNIVRYLKNGDVKYVYDYSCWEGQPVPNPPWNPLTGSERYPGIWLLGQTEPVIFN